MPNKQDSNLTGLSYAEEETLGALPGTPIWYGLEPNSYSDFGGQIATVARNPINATRQRKKGTVTDLDASGGFNQDLTQNNLTRLLQGFMFADLREKPSTIPVNGTAVPCTSVTAATDKFGFGSDPGAFVAGHLVKSSGFAVAANNLMTVVVSSDADDITVGNLLADEASPPATAKVEVVGFQFGSGTSSISKNGELVRFNDSATNMTTLGLLVGEWVYVGGDATAMRFATNAGGFARICAIAAGYLEFDKVSWTASAETGTGKTVQVFFGNVLRNEPAAADIVRRTYNIERTLGEDNDGVMSEYLVGAVANEMTVNIPQADKINVDLTFVAIDNEQRTGAVGVKGGTRPTLVAEDAINTSSDFARIKLALVDPANAAVSPLFAFATELTLTINNNVSPNKAIGTLGAFDTSTGTFEVGGSMTAYFADVVAVQAVRNNSDVTLDIVIAKDNAGIVFDIPLLSLGDGRLNVEQDQPITLPLEQNAAESAFGYTMLMMNFPYLPTAAG